MTTATPYTYRLATHPTTGDHGYEIGRWPAHADLNDPAQFEVVDHSYEPVAAMLRANALNAAPPPDHLPPDESSEGEAPVTRHASTRHRK